MIFTDDKLTTQEIEALKFLDRKVKYFEELVEKADEALNKDFLYAFAWHAETKLIALHILKMIRPRLKHAETRVINAHNLESALTILKGTFEEKLFKFPEEVGSSSNQGHRFEKIAEGKALQKLLEIANETLYIIKHY
jgi:hypothetical protein